MAQSDEFNLSMRMNDIEECVMTEDLVESEEVDEVIRDPERNGVWFR